MDNHALVATWPPEDLARAAAEAPAGEDDWPRLSGSVTDLDDASLDIARLEELLSTARRAERASTGAGTGAGAFNLRVARDVPYALVERVLYSAARAGYGAPRILLEARDGPRMLAWPTAPPRSAPTREEIEAIVRGATDGQAQADVADEPHAILAASGIQLLDGERLACGLEGVIDAHRLERCASEVQRTTGRDTLTLRVAPEARFGRVVSALQPLARAFPHIRIARGPVG